MYIISKQDLELQLLEGGGLVFNNQIQDIYHVTSDLLNE